MPLDRAGLQIVKVVNRQGCSASHDKHPPVFFCVVVAANVTIPEHNITRPFLFHTDQFTLRACVVINLDLLKHVASVVRPDCAAACQVQQPLCFRHRAGSDPQVSTTLDRKAVRAGREKPATRNGVAHTLGINQLHARLYATMEKHAVQYRAVAVMFFFDVAALNAHVALAQPQVPQRHFPCPESSRWLVQQNTNRRA